LTLVILKSFPKRVSADPLRSADQMKLGIWKLWFVGMDPQVLFTHCERLLRGRSLLAT